MGMAMVFDSNEESKSQRGPFSAQKIACKEEGSLNLLHGTNTRDDALSENIDGSLFLPPYENQEAKEECYESDLLITRCKHYCTDKRIHNFQQILLRAQSMKPGMGVRPSKV